jgi:hypothetical protein
VPHNTKSPFCSTGGALTGKPLLPPWKTYCTTDWNPGPGSKRFKGGLLVCVGGGGRRGGGSTVLQEQWKRRERQHLVTGRLAEDRGTARKCATCRCPAAGVVQGWPACSVCWCWDAVHAEDPLIPPPKMLTMLVPCIFIGHTRLLKTQSDIFPTPLDACSSSNRESLNRVHGRQPVQCHSAVQRKAQAIRHADPGTSTHQALQQPHTHVS